MKIRTKKITSIVLSVALTASMMVVMKGDGENKFGKSPVVYTQETDTLSVKLDLFSEKLDLMKTAEVTASGSFSEMLESEDVKELAAEMLEELPGLQEELERELAEADLKIDSLDSGQDEVLARKEAYEAELNENLLKTVTALTNLKDGNGTQDDVTVVENMFTEEDDEVTLGSMPNQAIVSELDSNPVESLMVNAPLKAYQAPGAADTSFDDEVRLTEAMKKKATELGTPKAVYEYVLNTYPLETYYGSRKGAVGTFEQYGGNDTDQASLLIAMLRYLGYPARYVFGTITITSEQAMAITGTETVESAGRLLASQFIPTSTVRKNGSIVGLKMKHTWVEAYIPYSDYRADGNMAGDSAWIPMDPSFKEVKVVVEDIALTNSSATINRLNSDYGIGLTKSTEGHAYCKEIVEQSFNYLPSSLPYTVADMAYSSTVYDSLKEKLSLGVDGDMLMSKSLASLYGKSITVSYQPEEEYDADLIESYGGITKVPAYLVNVCPTILVDGKEVGRGYGVSLGKVQYLYTYIQNRQGTTVLPDFMRAGSVYEIVLDLQRISSSELSYQYNRLLNADKLTNADPYSAEVLGPMLGYAGALYFSACDINNIEYSAVMGINRNRLLAEVMMGYKINVETIFGSTRKILPGNFQIDVGYNTITNISFTDDKSKEKEINILCGYAESAYEGQIWETISGGHKTGISTIKIMNEAKKQGIDTTVIVPGNVNEELAKCNLSQAAITDIKNAINNNCMVITTTKELTIDSWKGSGYIIVDPTNGSSAFMISGGLAGGSTSDESEEVSTTREILDGFPDEAIDLMVEKMFSTGMMIYYIEMELALKDLTTTVAEFEISVSAPIALIKGVNDLCDNVSTFNDISEYYGTLLDTFFDWAVYDDADAGRDFVAAIIDEMNGIFSSTYDDLKSIGADDPSDFDVIKDFANNLYDVVSNIASIFG